jgi:hypothetical protein
MSHEESLTGESFEQKLNRLRIKIDSLPQSQRPHLIDLADAMTRQHRQLQTRIPHNNDAD